MKIPDTFNEFMQAIEREHRARRDGKLTFKKAWRMHRGMWTLSVEYRLKTIGFVLGVLCRSILISGAITAAIVLLVNEPRASFLLVLNIGVLKWFVKYTNR